MTTVSGVGPKLAATLLAHVSQRDIAEMIVQEDVAGLVAVPGIGKKMAERIIIELRDKVLGGQGGEHTAKKGKSEEIIFLQQALEKLGFGKEEIHAMIDKMGDEVEEGVPVEEILKKILRK